MPTFEWNANFLTGLDPVDEQHRRLLDLINALGERLDRGGVSDREVENLFGELIDYADHHFSDEEALMEVHGLDARHVDRHIARHRTFRDELVLLRQNARSDAGSIATEVLDYLIHWLTHHILGEDQNMSRQIHAIEAGVDARTAFEQGERDEDPALEPLLDAVNGLLARLASQNQKLAELNRSLEQRVERRTRALAEANERLRVLSLTDPLTGLPNRRHAIEALEALGPASSRSDRPLAALMIDADHFKQINDRHGHEAGDAVLVELARTLRDSVRTDDRVFRLGGDEFLVLCPATDLQGAMRVADHLLARVAALCVPAGDGCWQGSVTIGLAVRETLSGGHAALLRAADEALYAAKTAGRGCVRSASSLQAAG